jgi:hypothetical protein
MRTPTNIRFDPAGQSGNATVIAVIVLFVIGSLAGVVLSVTQRHSAEISAMADQNRAFFVAQTGVNDALVQLEGGALVLDDEGDEVLIGSNGDPVEFSGGRYWVEVEREADSIYTLTSLGRAGLQEKVIEVVVQQQVEGVYRNGIFAGNSSDDPDYTLELGGRLGQADQVYGDVYSGGSVAIHGDAEVFGTIRAVDSVSGKGSSSAETGKAQSIPDIAGMDYESTADIQVAKEFDTGSPVYESHSAGGKAWQLPESNPAHIFRKNPSDRTTETTGTVKDDFFMEDPYEDVRGDSSSDGSDAYKVTLSGMSGEPGTNTNQKVFFIDGNLWIHNYKTMSFKFGHADPNGLQVTFVVKGNIYVSDNLYYTNNKTDGVAFIAMKDAAVPDSGNIYFGDPKFGTLERMYAYMYAENNFYDVNLSATGSAKVELHGNMTAGNQVKIRRDYTSTVSGEVVVQHSKLMVDFDERIADGELDLPGLPRTPAASGAVFEILSWREAERE